MKTNPIKVLHIIPTLLSGGAERQLTTIVTNISADVIENTVCVMSDPHFFAPSILESGSEVIDLKVSGKHPFFQTSAKFRKIIQKINPDVIQSTMFDANISARMARFFNNRIPLVTLLQAPDYSPEAITGANWNNNKIRFLKAIDKTTGWVAKPYYVACSEFVKNDYQQHFGIDEEQIEVIYNSIDSNYLSATESQLQKLRSELKFPKDVIKFLNIGRLDPQKNHKILFEAFRQVIEEVPNAVLLLVGTGGLENDLKKYTQDLQIADKVHFLGKRSDIGALLEFSDVFVFPSLFEGFGIALTEAMYKSLPCIVSKIDVFKEIITHNENGYIVDPNSPTELKNAMIKLFRDESLRKFLGGNAFNTVNRKFNIKVLAKEWERLYIKLSLKKNL